MLLDAEPIMNQVQHDILPLVPTFSEI